MTRNARVAAGLLAMACASAFAWTQVPTFPTEAKRVTVDVVVTDDDGEPVSGLTREDFAVEENGVPQQVVEFEAVEVSRAGPPPAPSGPVATNVGPDVPGRSFLLVVDDLNLTRASAKRIRAALSQFIETQVRENDLVTLAPTAGGSWWNGRMTRDREDLLAALAAVEGRRAVDQRAERMSDHEAMLIHTQRDPEAIEHVTTRYVLRGIDPAEGVVKVIAADVYTDAAARTRQALLGLERAMTALGGRRGRRAVVLASDGFMQDESLSEFRLVREAARRANAALYFVDARGLRLGDFGDVEEKLLPDPVTDPRFMSLEREYESEAGAGAESLADDTGGFAIRDTNRLAAGLARIGRESETFYLLGYEPQDKRADRRFRRIEVKVRRPGLKVRARRGYVPGDDVQAAGATRKVPGGATLPLEVLRALDAPSPERGIPLRLAVHVLGAASAGRASVLLTAEADPAALALKAEGDTIRGSLSSWSSVSARDTGETGRKERFVDLDLLPPVRAQMTKTWVPLSHAYELPPGRYQASLAVRDKGSGRIGSIRLEFGVPQQTGLRLTTPVLTDTLRRGEAGASAPVPIARRRFAAGARLACAFSVEGARSTEGAPRVDVTYEVRRADGTLVTRAGPTPLEPDEDGALSSRISMTLNRPGAYEIRIQAADGSGQATATEAFAVDPP